MSRGLVFKGTPMRQSDGLEPKLSWPPIRRAGWNWISVSKGFMERDFSAS